MGRAFWAEGSQALPAVLMGSLAGAPGRVWPEEPGVTDQVVQDDTEVVRGQGSGLNPIGHGVLVEKGKPGFVC